MEGDLERERERENLRLRHTVRANDGLLTRKVFVGESKESNVGDASRKIG